MKTLDTPKAGERTHKAHCNSIVFNHNHLCSCDPPERAPLGLKIGDTVRVYQKPITDEELEGLATLVQHFSDSDDPEIGERWSVRFTGEDQIVDRFVSLRNIQGWLSR